MANTNKSELPVGTTPETAKLHKRVERVCYVLLIGLVIEGALTFPAILAYYGFPTLSIHQICDEMDRYIYNDASRTCEVEPLYGPPFGGTGAGEGAKYAKDGGDATLPKPTYDRLGFRELVKIRDERLEREQQEREPNSTK